VTEPFANAAPDEWSARVQTSPLEVPSVTAFRQTFLSLGQQYQEIIVILSARPLYRAAYENVLNAVLQAGHRMKIHIFDSQTVADGLGVFVRAAAQEIQKGLNSAEILRNLQTLRERVYTMLCTPNLTYLAALGGLDPAQARAGEILGVLPAFLIEQERLVSVQKINGTHGAIELFTDFLNEFSNPRQVIFLYSGETSQIQIPKVVERLQNLCAKNTIFTQRLLTLPLMAMLGPQCFGLILVDSKSSV
jgi:DegV family protein with EDD domain